MNTRTRSIRSRAIPVALALFGLVMVLVLGACQPSATRTAAPADTTKNLANGGTTPVPGLEQPPAPMGQAGGGSGGSSSGTGSTGTGVVGMPVTVDPVMQMYQWVGQIVASDLEGRHLEIKRGCDSWVLLAESQDVAKKLEQYAGQKVSVWGNVSNEPSIYMKQAIFVRSVYGPNDPMIMMYVPDYPCPGDPTPTPPVPPMPGPIPYIGIDLQPGEIAAIGTLAYAGDATYLETPAGKILLKGKFAMPTMPPIMGGGVATPGTGQTAPDAMPSYAWSGEAMVVGKWAIEGGQLVISVRYINPLGYPYVKPMPTPVTPPVPPPTPGSGPGVIYGQVKIGPLCPVEPCPGPTPDVYSSRALVLASSSGQQIKVPLTPDGWFKQQVDPGTYVVTLTDCSFLGCQRALPQKVTIVAGQVTELHIDIDTGIR